MSHVAPRLSLLTAEQMAQTHDYALEILATTGVRVVAPEARALLARGGGQVADAVTDEVTDDPRVRIPSERVAWALAAAPTQIAVFDRRGGPAFSLGADTGARFGIGVTNLHYQDPLTDTVTPFVREHMARGARLGDALPSFDVISTLGILHDLPPETADLYATLEMVANTIKPLVLLISEATLFEPTLDLLAALCGDLAARPFILPYVNPITPLTIDAATSAKMSTAIGRGLPLIYSNYGMAGATTPITPTGALALLTAELLAGLTLAQLIARGCADHPGQPARQLRYADDDELLRHGDDAAEPGVRGDDGALRAAALRHIGQRRGLGRRPVDRRSLLAELSDRLRRPDRPRAVRGRQF